MTTEAPSGSDMVCDSLNVAQRSAEVDGRCELDTLDTAWACTREVLRCARSGCARAAAMPSSNSSMLEVKY
jgi:hypothetical protein